MKKTKLIHALSVCSLALGALGAVSAPLIQTHFATVVAAGVVADDTSTRSITLHKYTGEPKVNTDGSEPSTTVPDGAKPIGGISFTVQKVTKVAGKTFDASDSSTYTVDTGFAEKTVTTASDGTATADLGTGTAADGYYLVTEQESDAVTTAAAPFIVHVPMTHTDATSGNKSLLYDVNIYPKNELDDSSMLLNPTKTFTDNSTSDSVKSGADVSWNLTINRPSDIHDSGVVTAGNKSETVTNADGSTTTTDTTEYKTYANELKLVDVLDDKLMGYKDIFKVVISSPNSNAGMTDTALVKDTDYTVTADKADGKTTVTVALTDAGIKKFAAAPKDSKLVATIDTTVTADSDAKIINTFDTYYKGTITPDTETHQTTKPGGDGDDNTPTPTVYFGNVDVLKKSDDGQVLANATFTLYPTDADAKAGTHPVTKEDGSPYTVTTDKDGKAEFTGLEVNKDGSAKTYYLVETDAPAGYDLDQQVHAVQAGQNTDVDATVIDNDNLLPNLPLTGSQAKIVLYAFTTVLIVAGATGVYVMKRRQRDAK
jgi:hypothetical protein